MAERIFATVAGETEDGYSLQVGDIQGGTLPITKEQLALRGLSVVGDKVVVSDEARFKNASRSNPQGDTAIPTQEDYVALVAEQRAPQAPVQQIAEEPTGISPTTGETIALSPAEIPPEDLPSIPGISQAQGAILPGISTLAQLGTGAQAAYEKGLPEFLQPKTEEEIQRIEGEVQALGTDFEWGFKTDDIVDQAIAKYPLGTDTTLEEQTADDGETSLLVEPDRKDDYYTKLFFTDLKGRSGRDITSDVHDEIRDAVGFYPVVYDAIKKQHVRDANGGYAVNPSMIMFESAPDDLDGRTRELVLNRGMRLGFSSESGKSPINLGFIDADLEARTKNWGAGDDGSILDTMAPFYTYMTEEGGGRRVYELMESNGVSPYQQLYSMRRLQNAPLFPGGDQARVDYLVNNVWGGLLSLGGEVVADSFVDATIFLATWMGYLYESFPETVEASAYGLGFLDEERQPEEIAFLREEIDKAVQDRRFDEKTTDPLTRFVINLGWDATQKYAEDHNISYEEARSALMANRGFVEAMSMFLVEGVAVGGPFSLVRIRSGVKAARQFDDWIIDTFASNEQKKLYQLANRRGGQWGSGARGNMPPVPDRFEVVDQVISNVQKNSANLGTAGTFTGYQQVANAYRNSREFQTLSEYQKKVFGDYWTWNGIQRGSFQNRAELNELLKRRGELVKESLGEQAKNGDTEVYNKLRGELLDINVKITDKWSSIVLPPNVSKALEGETYAAGAAAFGYMTMEQIGYTDVQKQDMGALAALSGALTPWTQNKIWNPSKNWLHSALYKFPKIKGYMDRNNLKPLTGVERDAWTMITETADPVLSSIMMKSLRTVADNFINITRINERLGRQVIDPGLYVRGLGGMLGLSRTEDAINTLTSNPKMSDIVSFGDTIKHLEDGANASISMRDQVAEALTMLKAQIKGVPEGTGDLEFLQNEIKMMENFVKYADESIQNQLVARESIFEEFAGQVNNWLDGQTTATNLGVALSRELQTAAEEGRTINLRDLTRILLDKDKLREAGMSDKDIRELGGFISPIEASLTSTETGLKLVDQIIGRSLRTISEFNEDGSQRVSKFASDLITILDEKSAVEYGKRWDALDNTYQTHRVSATTPIQLINEDGSIETVESIADYIEKGLWQIDGATQEVSNIMTGKRVKPAEYALHGVLEEGAGATIDDIVRRIPGTDAGGDGALDLLTDGLAAKYDLSADEVNLNQFSNYEKWKVLGEELVKEGLVDNFDAYKTGMGRIGIKFKDYRLIISNLGRAGDSARGFQQYGPYELRGRLLDSVGEFEMNFYENNLALTRGEIANPMTDPALKEAYKTLKSDYKGGRIDPFINDPLIAKILRANDRNDYAYARKAMTDIESKYGIGTDTPDWEGYQKFWARIGGVQDETGEFVIDLTPNPDGSMSIGQAIQKLITNRAMQKLAESAAGKQALKLRKRVNYEVVTQAMQGATSKEDMLARLDQAIGVMEPEKLEDYAELVNDLPFGYMNSIQNMQATVLLNGEKVRVPLVAMNEVYAPIMPESVSSTGMTGFVEEILTSETARREAVEQANKLVKEQRKVIKKASEVSATDLDMEIDMLQAFGMGAKTVSEAKRKVFEIISAGPARADEMRRFENTYMKTHMSDWNKKNPNATAKQRAAEIARVKQTRDDMLRNVLISYLFDAASTPGAQQTFRLADGSLTTANPANINGGILFDLLGMGSRAGGETEEGKNLRLFFEQIGASNVFEEMRFHAQTLFERGPDGNIRIQNMPTPINLNHVATRVVAGLRGQVSPRWLVIEHVLRKRSIKAGDMFQTIMLDPEIGKSLVELATRQDLTPKEIEGHISIFYRIINHAARTEASEQFLQDLREDRDSDAMTKLGVKKSNRELAQRIRTKLNNPDLKPDQPVIGSVIAPTEGSQTIPAGA